MASKAREVVGAEELVIKNGGHRHDDYEPNTPGYGDSEEYPSKGYERKPRKPEYGGSEGGGYERKPRPTEPYPTEPYPAEPYPADPYGRTGRRKPFFAKGSFETPIPISGMFDGEIWASVHEDGGIAPTNIIRIDQDWGVLVKWRTSGCLTRMICGTYCLNVCLESIGPGPELRLPEKSVKVELDPCSAQGDPLTANYKCYIDIPRGTVKPEHCSVPYKVVTTLTYLEPCGTPGPIAAYVEGQILQFYEP
jgi:hypothetical protein